MADPLWTVKNVTDTTLFPPGQGSVSGKKVTFVTATGATSSIDIADSDFDPDTVASQIHQVASNIIQVQGLTGPDMAPGAGSPQYDPAMYPNG
ncbi:MAG TPA: hypothetical protein VGF75_06850 [Candidatus Saccharimonadales bacterium]|jgi:hypothetical protein